MGDGFRIIQLHYTQAQLLLCSLIPNRPGLVPVQGLEVGDPTLQGALLLARLFRLV